MMTNVDRRSFLKTGALALGGLGAGLAACKTTGSKAEAPVEGRGFSISLAEWSLHRTLYSGKLDPLHFSRAAREVYGIGAVEYVNSFFKDKAQDRPYLKSLKRNADEAGVKQLLIMIDGEGALGDPDESARIKTVENHKKWVEAAAFLGCHAIRVNAASKGSEEEQQKLCADGAVRLVEFAKGFGINVIVENHGGLSSNGKWLAGLMEAVNSPHFGTLPDFGNFGDYDRYQGVRELMPYAKAVSAKSHDFDKEGNEIHTDYFRMMQIVLDAGYHGYVGVEYEGRKMSETDGIWATRRLLERVRTELLAPPRDLA
jgi:sugar phosphate isomerase/epimerase